ncbi:siderophore-interacting protein [Brachybacterium sp. AOP43-C2-M15]|uniref:siderophore-interacting protein n=1 Tax=Brachybacterium sp. AOP43-C2-M15 TaxID=3457661 RepID=UPI0040338DF7
MARSLRPLDVYPITVRELEVLRVRDVTPGMRRVTLGGEQLRAHTAENGFPVAAFRSDTFDDEGKLILRHPEADVPVAPTQADGVLNWPREDPHLLFRTYTVRRWDPQAGEHGEVDLDFVRHGVGPATSWAYRVQPGERVHWAGPKSSAPHPVGVDWTLVAGDETALPAIGRWLEEWPEGARGQVFIEVAERDHVQDLPVPEGVELTWFSRDGDEAGTTSTLFDAITGADWWEGRAFAWVAGETLTLVPIRRWLRGEKGLPKEQVEVTGYWRRQEVVVDEATGEQDLEATEDHAETFHELSEIMPGLALRVAATVGLADAFDGDARTPAELAARTGADGTGIGKLVRYLEAIGITEVDDQGRHRLTGPGRELEDDRVQEQLDLEGLRGIQEIAVLLSLLPAVRGAGPAPLAAEMLSRLEADPALVRTRLEQEADVATYVAGAFARSPALEGLRRAVVAGKGASTIAHALTTAHPELETRILAAPGEVRVHRDLVGDAPRITVVEGALGGAAEALGEADADVVVLVENLGRSSDEEAVRALRGAAEALAPQGSVLALAEVLEPELAHDHDYEEDLVGFALHGGGIRTHEEHLALFEAAGLSVPERSTVGWGFTVYRSTAR